MLDVILDYILFDSLGCPPTFFIIFDIRIRLRLKTNEFGDWDATSFVLEFSNDFLIDIAMMWSVLWIVTIVKHILVSPKVLICVHSLYFIG